MRIKKTLFVLLLLMLPLSIVMSQSSGYMDILSIPNKKQINGYSLMNNDANSGIINRDYFATANESDSVIIDSTVEIPKKRGGFMNFEILSGIGPTSMGENKNSGLPIGFGVSIPIENQWYFFHEYQIVINNFPGQFMKNLRDCEIDFSICYLEKMDKFGFFVKSGLMVFYKSEIAIMYLLLNFGLDVRYRIMEKIDIFAGISFRSSGWGSLASSAGRIKIGISKNF